MANVRIGISGWTYPGWRGDFYPKGLPQRLELDYAASRLSSIEINGSFYSLQRPSSYAKWRDETPEGFVFAVKGGRFITHMKRLSGVEAPLANFFASGVLALDTKLGPFLWQLPENLAFDADLVEGFLAQLPRTSTEAGRLAERHDGRLAGDRVHTAAGDDRPLRHAMEVRSASFVDAKYFELLRKYDVASVVADTAGRWPFIDERSSDFEYVRLHGDAELYASGYSPSALNRWADRCRSWLDDGRDVFVYFDNDSLGYASHDAQELISRLP